MKLAEAAEEDKGKSRATVFIGVIVCLFDEFLFGVVLCSAMGAGQHGLV